MTRDRYPRTLAEAFGPHTSQHIDEPDERISIFRVLVDAIVRLFR